MNETPIGRSPANGGRPKQYANSAERARAWRERRKQDADAANPPGAAAPLTEAAPAAGARPERSSAAPAPPLPPRAAPSSAVDGGIRRGDRDADRGSAAEAWKRVGELEAELDAVRAALAEERATHLADARAHIGDLQRQLEDIRRERS